MILKLLGLTPKSLIEKIFFRWYWVIIFSLTCLLFYEQTEKQRHLFFKELKIKQEKLLLENRAALRLHEELLLHIQSQEDPEYIRLTLMKVLGVVPKGSRKFFFRPSHD